MEQDLVASEPLKKRTSRAVGLLAVQSIGARFVLFLSNWILGALLTQDAFGISGLVLVISTFSWTFVGFGLDDVVVQRGRGLRLWEATAFRSSLVIAILTSFAVIALAPAFGLAFHEPRIIGPVLVLSAAFPLASLSIVTGAKLAARMDFDFIIQWGVVELFVGQGLTILFAWAGFSIYSFALPVPILMALRAIAYFLRAPPVRTRGQKGRRRRLLLRRGAMVAGSKFINNLVSQGDYIVLGVLSTTTEVGYYYFAFRLAATPVRTIAQSLNSVLFPAIANFRADPVRQAAAAMKSAKLLAWIVTPICYFQIVVASPILHMLFGDKWAPSILIIQLLSVGLAFEGIMAVTRAYLSATGKFRIALFYSIANGAGFFCSCLIGALLGATNGLALAISIYYIATQPLLFAFLVNHQGHRLANLIAIFIAPNFISAFSFAFGWAASRLAGGANEPVFGIALSTLVSWPVFLLLFWLAAPDTLRQLVELARSLLLPRAAPVSAQVEPDRP